MAQRGSVVRFSKTAFDAALARAPIDAPARAVGGVAFSLPMPDGSLARFRVVESPIISAELAADFSEIRTYAGQGIDDPTATTRFGWTPAGFHAIVLSHGGTSFVDPYVQGNLDYYVAFAKADARRPATPFTCLVDGTSSDSAQRTTSDLPFSNGTTLRIYRLAVAATGEYTAAAGGTKALALSRMVTTMCRVNGIYEREIAVRLVMSTGTATDSTALIYTDGTTDPYTNDDGSLMLSENQTNLDGVIGTANYDMGHVFSTGGGGIAILRSPCSASYKAMGVTSSPNSTGDAYDVDTWRTKWGTSSAEAIRSTAPACPAPEATDRRRTPLKWAAVQRSRPMPGICNPEDLQLHSNDYFHMESLNEITAFLTTSGASCGRGGRGGMSDSGSDVDSAHHANAS
ncbi:MAG: hypothetical protein A3H96_04595 [Acidobacteria bacterium RIFCSPLOWO2_02_FULL_67_36]|nr:MAG: hypothetical protein A3H96_04595 [Acidobacteria bacterium RIFCSPLOWO2_02_FULL_67_36]OFW24247.1 MAG: hypothetical protein A3G21_12330 [Acidobacteria bacterium RIFCSPLOWO2_12_FULL_66_21]